MLARAAACWSGVSRHDFPHGVVVYLGPEVELLLPACRPLRQESVSYSDRFDTTFVRDALAVRQSLSYGVVVLDGDEATWGVVQPHPESVVRSCSVTKVGHATANIASRTRRGGSSSARYGRNRDGEELAFLRKVAEQVSRELGDLRGIIIGGRADMKRKLLRELPLVTQERVLPLVDLACGAGLEGLRALAARVPQIASEVRQQEVDDHVARFLDLVAQTSLNEAPCICYGEAETRAALHLGAVERLLVEHRSGAAWLALATSLGAAVTEVRPVSELAQRFCAGFRVGALLRYAVDPALLEEDDNVVCDSTELPIAGSLARWKCAEPEGADSDEASVSTAEPQTEGSSSVVQWMRTAFERALHDEVAAESLTACAEVLLFGSEGPDAESLEATVEVLRGEGVPDEILAELVCHVTDLFDAAH